MSGGYFVLGSCWSCGRSFTFNPHRVPSIPIDPMTSLPPDVDDHGNTREVDPDAVGRAVRQPICAACVERGNAKRLARGQKPIPVLDGAYEFVEGLP